MAGSVDQIVAYKHDFVMGQEWLLASEAVQRGRLRYHSGERLPRRRAVDMLDTAGLRQHDVAIRHDRRAALPTQGLVVRHRRLPRKRPTVGALRGSCASPG